MKRLILLLGVLVSLAVTRMVFAQTEGTITYEAKVNMHRNIPPEREQMKTMMPEFRISSDLLAFNETESLYKPIIEEEDDEDINGGGGVVMRIQRPQNEIYVNQSESRRLRLQEFMGKRYLIEDSLALWPWKISAETKEILGYTCRKATYFNEERKITTVAWFTDKLRPFLGPETFHSLPGAVLQVDINDGERMLTATKIDFRELKKNDLKMTSGGTKTTEEEFRKIMSEQLERMKANGGNIMIRN